MASGNNDDVPAAEMYRPMRGAEPVRGAGHLYDAGPPSRVHVSRGIRWRSILAVL